MLELAEALCYFPFTRFSPARRLRTLLLFYLLLVLMRKKSKGRGRKREEHIRDYSLQSEKVAESVRAYKNAWDVLAFRFRRPSPSFISPFPLPGSLPYGTWFFHLFIYPHRGFSPSLQSPLLRVLSAIATSIFQNHVLFFSREFSAAHESRAAQSISIRFEYFFFFRRNLQCYRCPIGEFVSEYSSKSKFAHSTSAAFWIASKKVANLSK